MKINSIKLKNIHSLKGIHEVDFVEGPLSQTGLFAIVGPTGSGKSTLLDAITLALFNATPRSGGLSNTVIDKMGAVITRNTDEAFCEVEYESSGRVYRSRWEISRARTGKLREYHMSIAIKNDIGAFTFLDLKRSEIPAKNTEIIGLNYDQFV
ncbi:MAG: AAA family ATPase, partial [Bacteroidales bacterium]|nr:AAA family ATPase [Bacteroidales bacterium]